MANSLYCGDNLDILRSILQDESVDLCYIDPPFHSNKNYNQVYSNSTTGQKSETHAFTDVWEWNVHASDGFAEIIDNHSGRFGVKTIALFLGLHTVVGPSGLLAYLVSLVFRISEIHRILKSSGSFYLHCDPTASHYLKIIGDSIFLPTGGAFRNEIVWTYKTGGVSTRWFGRKHDTILFYTKSDNYVFNVQRDKSYIPTLPEPHTPSGQRLGMHRDEGGKFRYVAARDVWEIDALFRNNRQRLGYPTQKPEALLERIVRASSNEGDLVLDPYCGSGTTLAVAQSLGRRWIGIDSNSQAIEITRSRLGKLTD